MAVSIIFESHATTHDNEAHLASGWNDVDLSSLGVDQAKDLGDRYHGKKIDAIFISDLVRAYHTAEIAFHGKGIPIIQDPRLRECDYGDMTQHPSSEVDTEKPKRITVPFPNGESYGETTEKMKTFLDGLKQYYDGQSVMIIGHRATQYALENLILGKPLEEVVPAPWSWQPGWTYILK